MKSILQKIFVKHYVIYIAIVMIELLVIVLTGVNRLDGRPDIAYSSEGNIMLSNQIYDTQKFEINSGIYQINIKYSLQQNASCNMKMVQDSDDDIYVHGIECDNLSLPAYEEQVNENVYVNRKTCFSKIQFAASAKKAGELNSICVYYLKWRSFFYAEIKLIFIFLCIDVCIWMILSGKWNKIDYSDRQVILGIAVIAFLANIPLYTDSLAQGHDLGFHLLRISNIAEGLKNKTFPVKIQSSWINGAGYSTGVCYGDILLYPSGIMKALGFPLRWVYKIYVFGINILTAIIAWFSFYRISHSKKAGLICSACYTLSMWHLVDLYTRAAVGEYSAMAFFPLVCLGLYLWIKQQKHAVIVLTIGISGIIETHILSTLIVGEFVILFCVFCWRKWFHKKQINDLIKILVLTVLLNLGFLLPLLDYLINIPMAVKNVKNDIQQYGVYLAQLIMTQYEADGVSNTYSMGIAREMPLTIGAGLLLIFGIDLYLMYHKKIKNIRVHAILLILMFVSLFLTSIYMPYDWLQSNFPSIYHIFGIVEFPWRYFEISTVLSVLILALILRDSSGIKEKFVRYIGIIVLGTVMFQGMSYIAAFMGRSNYYSYNDSAMIDSFYMAGDYVPQGIDINVYKNDSIRYNNDQIVIGKIDINATSRKIEVENKSIKDQYIEVPIIYYPGYKARSTNANLMVEKGRNGMVRVYIAAGYKGEISIYYQEPWYWRIGESVSIITGLLMLLCSMKKRKIVDS